ncbi:hypothetical protein K3495_g5955 [Podosphaera aphanis]|nr:hypothetical protein K3495_g5955 [Podosphaera aphanis]
MAESRLESHSPYGIKQWFVDYRQWCKIRKIRKTKRVWNMDETGARIRCPSGLVVMVPKDVKELYTGSPETRVSIIVVETISAAGNYQPPFVILPGQKLMDNLAHQNPEDNARVTTSPTGYISNEAMLEYLDHFIKFSDSGPRKPWSMHLLDGHKCHYSNEFLIKAEKINTHLQIFSSHETHALYYCWPA